MKRLSSFLLAPLLFLTFNGMSQTIDDLMIKLNSYPGVNLGEKRQSELYENLKSNPDSVRNLYNYLDQNLSYDVLNIEPKLLETNTENFYDVNAFNVDFDPESLSDNALIVYSATYCKPCEKLKTDLKEYIKENNVENFEVYYILEDLDKEGNQAPAHARDNSFWIEKIFRNKPSMIPYTCIIKNGEVVEELIGSHIIFENIEKYFPKKTKKQKKQKIKGRQANSLLD